MKKIFFILVFLLLAYGGSYQAMDNREKYFPDSVIIQNEPTILSDSIRKNKDKRITSLKIDTTSNIIEIRKNREIIDYQQKQLDSLLAKRR
jgi:hypothetical protein